MQLTIHRGTDEIGGSCVEIRTGKTRIFIDAGLPLDDSPAKLPASIHDADAVFVSHCHQDHYGLLENLPQGIPVYIGEVGWSFIRATQLFRNRPLPEWSPRFLKAWDTIAIGDLKITPYLVDHSAPDAYAFLVQDETRRVFYSGDFRSHGRKGILFNRLVAHPPSGIDALLIEGTMFGRGGQRHADESHVEEDFLDLMRSESGPVFLICSGQNIDRLVSGFRAANRAGRQLVIDIYTAWILEEMGRASHHTPKMEWPEVRVLTKGLVASRHYGIVKDNPEYFGDFGQRIFTTGAAIRTDEIMADASRFFIKANVRTALAMIEQVGNGSASVAYSMWPGYMTAKHNPREAPLYDKLHTMPNIRLETIHTSGHAVVDDLVRLADALSPRHVIPIHTEHKQNYPDIFHNVVMLDDGESFSLCPPLPKSEAPSESD